MRLKGTDSSDVELTLRTERRAGTSPAHTRVGTLRVSLGALQAIDLLTQSVEAATSALAPPTTGQLLRLSHAVLTEEPLPEVLHPASAAAKETEAVEVKPKPEAGGTWARGIDFELLDSLPTKPVPELAAEGGKRSEVQEARAQKALRTMVDGAQKLAVCRRE